jgi:predicted nucleic acid-binding Zn ribbon protein
MSISYGWCEACEQQITTQIFRGEKWCSEKCRKVIQKENDGPASAMDNVKRKKT